jgi:hypothetical protein
MSDTYDDCKCDFLYCKKDFGFGRGERVAIIKDGQPIAFCREHCKQLQTHGVKLRPLSEVHKELQERRNKIKNFIESLR